MTKSNNETVNPIIAELADLTFGVEIETVQITRSRAAQTVQSIVGGTIAHIGTPYCYDPYKVTADDGRVWTVMGDSSLNAPSHLRSEVVSPILRYGDIDTMQKVVRALRAAGAKVNSSCGVHIHVGAAQIGAKGIRNIAKAWNKQEDLITAALGTSTQRLNTFCKKTDADRLDRIEKAANTLTALNRAWYGYSNHSPAHYHSSRYHCLNLHTVWQKGTVEFRCFNGTLHAGKIKAYVQFCLAFCNYARKARATSSTKRPLRTASSKYDFRNFLIRLGLIGAEFKTANHHLLSRLNGGTSQQANAA